MELNTELFKIAYKKLKSSLYYDKTQTIERDKIVTFESGKADIDKYLEKLAEEFLCRETRKKLFDKILSKISFCAFPKSLVVEESDIIKNYSESTIEILDNQYFINMGIEGHILGVLWLLMIGYRVDNKMYNHSYGNRIRKKLYNELSEKPTYSPYLFEPYFQQYESWRDTAMDKALQHLHSEQDVVILTLDFKRFYYSVDVSKFMIDEIYDDIIGETEEDTEELRALNDFIYDVIERYAKQFEEFNGRRILPIGFLPSNILANYALRNFDKAVLDGWNPIYFGRYVDDVIIVDKIEKNSDLFKRTQANNLKANDIISYFLEQCSGWKGINNFECEAKNKYALLYRKKDEEGDSFVLNEIYNPSIDDSSHIVVKNDKVKIFYFKSGESDALITCFKDTISKNKSEFRHMPEDEAVFQSDDYNKIYDLQNDETINKFRGIKKISIDKFELSKLLGKHLRIGGLITDIRETGFEKQIVKILNPRVIIENYNVWEKIIEILVINESWDTLKIVVDNITKAIISLSYKDGDVLKNIQKTMYGYLLSIISRTFALVWGTETKEVVKSLCYIIMSADRETQMLENYIIESQRKAYCKTRMVDKSVMPIFIDMLNVDKIYEVKNSVNLTNFIQMIEFCKKDWKNNYCYYPYLVTMYDFSIISCIQQLMKSEYAFSDLAEMYEEQIKNYISSNYRVLGNEKNVEQWIQVEDIDTVTMDKIPYLVSVKSEKKENLKLALANVRLNHSNFEKVVLDKPNRSYERYKAVSKLINEAIDEKADMLFMPEAYMPFEWLTTVARTCARNNLALVSGIEHIKIGNKIYNLTAIILPYDDLINRSAFIFFHLKTHYAPAEKREINGYRLTEVVGDHYELYKWHECYFPVYCCYELTSIIERAMFQSYADFLVAIEWNRDINYYSNILESLSRDVHCYCVQVNSSDYGDSRITKPSKTEEKDIIRTKGGINSTILVDEINIDKLREFQFKEHDLQASDKRFKPTPPGFKPEIVLKKMKGESVI